MVFKKINTIFFKEKTSFLYIFCLLPWKFVESLLQTFSQTFRGGCKFDWNFQCKLAGLDWKFQCKLSRLDWKFKETCRATLKVFKTFNVALQVSLNFQSSLESLHWNFQSSPASLHWKFQSNLQPPPESLTESLQQIFNKLSGQQTKNIEKTCFFFNKNSVYFLENYVCLFQKNGFSFQKIFFF